MAIQRRTAKGGVSVIELLMVVAITGMLVSLLLPAVNSAREAARAAVCRSQMRQLAMAIEQFHGARHTYPPSRFIKQLHVGPEGNGWSWITKVLPYLEDGLRGDFAEPLGTSELLGRKIPVLLCPTDGFTMSGPRWDAAQLEGLAVGQTNYKAVSGANWGADATQNSPDIDTQYRNVGTNGSYDGYSDGDGIMFRNDADSRMRHAKVIDGLSKTFLLGEDLPKFNAWCSWPYVTHVYGTCAIPPNTIPNSPEWWPDGASFRSRHPHGLHFAMADCSVRFIDQSIDQNVYQQHATREGETEGHWEAEP